MRDRARQEKLAYAISCATLKRQLSETPESVTPHIRADYLRHGGRTNIKRLCLNPKDDIFYDVPTQRPCLIILEDEAYFITSGDTLRRYSATSLSKIRGIAPLLTGGQPAYKDSLMLIFKHCRPQDLLRWRMVCREWANWIAHEMDEYWVKCIHRMRCRVVNGLGLPFLLPCTHERPFQRYLYLTLRWRDSVSLHLLLTSRNYNLHSLVQRIGGSERFKLFIQGE
jgi:hypothetical protein